jgi:hypothetical protein
MKFDFDPIKNQLNFLKHGFYLDFAWQIDWNEGLIWPDFRKPYFEDRMCCLAPSGKKVVFYCVRRQRGFKANNQLT